MRNYITFSALGEQGRLGNQLFQIAATMSAGFDNKLVALFSDWKYNKYLQNPIPVFPATEPPVSPTHFLIEDSFHYTPIDLSLSIAKNYREGAPKIYDLSGYFQSEKYFSSNAGIIRRLFDVKKEFLLPITTFFHTDTGYSISSRSFRFEFCAIHIRRGDYVDNLHYAQLGMDYYHAGMNIIRRHCSKYNKEPIFVIFSDDIPWCKHNFTKSIESDRVIFSNVIDDFSDMTLMSLCDHFITANSSFSWWGAYLGKNFSKQVIFPSQWFGLPKSHKKTNDLYFEGSCHIIP